MLGIILGLVLVAMLGTFIVGGLFALLWTLISGLVVGIVARFILPGHFTGGLLYTALLGVGGSMLANLLGHFLRLYRPGQGAGFIASILGALLILMLMGNRNLVSGSRT